jgi:hypothetical protein
MLAKFVGMRKVRAIVAVATSLMLVMATAATVGAAGVGNGAAVDRTAVHRGNSDAAAVKSSPAIAQNDALLPLSITFYEELCPDYSYVPRNSNPSNYDRTGGHYNDLGGTQPDVVYRPAGCQPADGWQFNLGASIGSTNDTTSGTSGGSVVVDLSDADVALARGGSHLTISEVTNDALAGFGALRCTGDIQNGDNEEWVHVADSVSHADCVAYNVKQVIKFGAVPTGTTVGVTGKSVTANSTSGLAVTYSSLTSDVCTVNSTTGALTLLKAGTCTIQAAQLGQSSIASGTPDFPFWSAAVDVTQSFAITPASATCTVKPYSVTFDNAAHTATTAGCTVGAAPVAGTFTLTNTTHTNVGDYTSDTWSFTSTDGNYTASGTVHDTITPATPVITVTCTNHVYTGSAILGCTAVENGPGIPTDTVVPMTSYSNNVNVGTATGTATVAATGNYALATGTGTFLITPATLTVKAADKSMSYGGTVPTLTSTVSGFVNGDTETTVTITGHADLATTAGTSPDAGTYPITVGVTGMSAANYIFVGVPGTLTVNAIDQTIIFPNPGSKLVTDADFGLMATASSGLPVRYTWVSGPCSVTDGKVHLAGTAGDCKITADQDGNSNVNPAPSVSQTFSIGKLPQSITFVNPGTKQVNSLAFALGATASSTLPVSYVVNSGPCSVDKDGQLTITGAGICSVTASQPGNDTYNAATSVTRVFAILKLPQTITFNSLPNVTVGVGPITLNATSDSGLAVVYNAAGTCTVSGNTLTVTGVGICFVTATQPGNDFYYPALPVIRSFTISKAPQTITFGPLADKTYGDAPIKLTATASSGLTVTFTVSGNCTLESDHVTVDLGNVGTCTATARQSGNASYFAATPVSQTFNITKATLTVTANDQSMSYGGTVPTPLTYKIGGFVHGDTAGTVTITGLPILATGATSSSDAGGYPITVDVSAMSAANYKFSGVNGTLTIGAIPSHVTVVCPLSEPYVGVAYAGDTCTATVDGLLVGGLPISVPVTYSDNLNAGTAGASAKWDGDTNYTGSTGTGSFEITKAAVELTASDQTKTYGDSSFVLDSTAFTVTGGTLYNSDITGIVATSLGTAVTATVANYDIVPTGVTGPIAGNYDVTFKNGQLAVTQAILTIKAANQSKNYFDNLDLDQTSPSSDFSAATLFNGDTVTSVTLTCDYCAAYSAVGDHPIVPSGAIGTGLGNYDIHYSNGTLSINNKPKLTVTVKNQFKVYGTTMDLSGSTDGFTYAAVGHNIDTGVTVAGLEAGDTITSVDLTSAGTVATATVAGSTYPITCAAYHGNASFDPNHYDITCIDGDLTVTPAKLTIAATDQTKTVGLDIDLGHTNFTTSGLLNGDTVASVELTSSGAPAAAGLGSYDIDITSGTATGSGLDNYTITLKSGTLNVIEQRVLTVTADNKTRNYKKANPTFTYTITGPFDPGDDASIVDTKPTCSTLADLSTLPGTYAITCDGAGSSSGKYAFNYVNGTLTVKGSAVQGETAPTTATTHDNSSNSGATPGVLLLICLAFSGLGLLAVAAQRKSTRA